MHGSPVAALHARESSSFAAATPNLADARDHDNKSRRPQPAAELKPHESPKTALKPTRKATLDWHGQWRAAARAQTGKRLWPGFAPETATSALRTIGHPTRGDGAEGAASPQPEQEQAPAIVPDSSAPDVVARPKSTEGALERDRLLNGLDMRLVLLGMHSNYGPLDSPSQDSSELKEFYNRTQHLDHLGRLRLVWRTFRAYSDLGRNVDDLEAALTFLNYLASPTLTLAVQTTEQTVIDMDTRLRASLECLQDLLETAITESDVAVAPTWITKTGSSVPQHVSLRVILLRTVAPLALKINSLDLAVKASTSLLALRAENAISVSDTINNPDVELVKSVLAAVTSSARLDSLTTYDKRSKSAAKTDKLLALSVKLLDALAEVVSPASASTTGSVTQPDIERALHALADEIGQRHRPDILATMWTTWGLGRQWQLAARWRIMIARWTNGSAFTRSRLPPAPQYVFDQIVQATTEDVKSSRCDDWTNADKVSWIETLTSGPPTPKTMSACKQAYLHWMSRSGSSFALTAGVSLKVATLAVKLGQNEFAHDVAIAFVSRRTANQSPFLTLGRAKKTSPQANRKVSTTVIPHADLTALAGLYSLLGDHASVDHVFRHMASTKMLPDGRDLDILLSWAASGVPLSPEKPAEDDAVQDPLTQLLNFARHHDVWLSVSNLKGAVKAVLRLPATTTLEISTKVDRLKRLFNESRACQLSSLEMDELRLVVRSHLAGHRRELSILRRVEMDQVTEWRRSIDKGSSLARPVTILRSPWSDMGDLVDFIPEAVCLPLSETRRSNREDLLAQPSDVVSRSRVMSLLLDCRKHKDVRLAVETFLFVADPTSQATRASFFDDGIVRVTFKTILSGWKSLSSSEDPQRLLKQVGRAFDVVAEDGSNLKRVDRKETIDLVYQVGIKVLGDKSRIADLLASGAFEPSARQRRIVQAFIA
ncbi:hypothetical protein OIV83_006312 [Microbotryomycetes sp. JL201]|nr:hypothetical protein OIV83_006312 [Microbotryomycetes sp. JL201]